MNRPLRSPGPFRADQIGDGDYYELSNGHPIECSPSGRDHTGPNVSGVEVLDADPDVEWSGVDAGFAPEPGTLRAPDVAVGDPVGEGSGWIPGAPPLAVEYAGAGQDEARLQQKIQDLLAAGTRFVWVVRLLGPRRVEVYEPGETVRMAQAADDLRAPGVLRNPIPVAALYDRDTAHEVTLRNLLQRHGYENLDAVRAESTADSILILLESRNIEVGHEIRTRILACQDLKVLRRWLVRATAVASVEELFSEEQSQNS